MKKLVFSFFIPLVAAALLLVVSYPYFPSSSSSPVNEIGAFFNDTAVTFSFLTPLLKGLGGGSTTPTTMDNHQAAAPPPRSGPLSVADFSTCRRGPYYDRLIPMDCCPPVNTTPAVDFSLLPKSGNLRVRRALHLLDDEYMAKFTRAFQLMRELPPDDPRSFSQQVNIHCAYSEGGHRQAGFPDKPVEIHGNWLLFPWHRMYIYFFERILGKLIDDPTFALPYWNWDSPEAMQMPEQFADKNSPFYEEFRDEKHQPPVTLDLNYDSVTDSTASDEELKMNNLVIMYRQTISVCTTPELFHGQPYYPGDDPVIGFSGRSCFEVSPHGAVHEWLGDRKLPNHEAMATAYLAGRDPLFYVFHSNIDRIWSIWKTAPGGNRTDLADPDWLNSEFMFYDEEARLVKMKVKDCLDMTKLGITFDDDGVAPPWFNSRPTPRDTTKEKKTNSTAKLVFPIKLVKVVRLVVPRMKQAKHAMKENKKQEVLVIEAIEVYGDKTAKFDVIINDGGNHDGIGPAHTEFAGSYWGQPGQGGKRVVDSLTLGGISDLLVGLGAQHDESVVVSLVPRYAPDVGTSVGIGGVKFDFA